MRQSFLRNGRLVSTRARASSYDGACGNLGRQDHLCSCYIMVHGDSSRIGPQHDVPFALTSRPGRRMRRVHFCRGARRRHSAICLILGMCADSTPAQLRSFQTINEHSIWAKLLTRPTRPSNREREIIIQTDEMFLSASRLRLCSLPFTEDVAFRARGIANPSLFGKPLMCRVAKRTMSPGEEYRT